MLIQKPLNIAICFNAPTVKRALEQKEMLISLESDFNIEWDIRAERIEGNMLSYSQMINEAVLATQAEFMIFINPSAIPTPEDVHTMIDDLCSGFAFSSIIAFGFYGLTKEVFRRIGMMDERFIGGEHEDTDFLLRLKQNNLAINYRYRIEQYPHWGLNTDTYPFLSGQFRSITQTIFEMKWTKKENVFYRTDLFLQDKKGPRWLLENKRHDIFKSWKPWKETKYDSLRDGIVFTLVYKSDISNKIAISKKTRVNGTLNILSKNIKDPAPSTLQEKYPFVQGYTGTKNGNLLLLEFLSDTPTDLIIMIADKNQQQISPCKRINSNTWNLDDFPVDICDIRVYHDGRVTLHHNNFSMLGAEESYNLGLDIYQFSIENE